MKNKDNITFKTRSPFSSSILLHIMVTILLIACALPDLLAQKYLEVVEKSKTGYFDEIVKEVEEYYKDQDKGKGTGYNQFKRWEDFNRTRLDEKGRLQNVARNNFDEYYKNWLPKNNFRAEAEESFSGSWSNMGPGTYIRLDGYNGGNGRVNCLAVDPSNSSILYAGTPAGGLWRSTNGGSSWAPLTDGLTSIGVSGIAIDPTSPSNNRRIYILTGDGDGGDTRSIGVLVSTDNGISWNSTGLSWNVTNGIFGYKLIMHPTNPLILLAATTNGIYRTIDGALSWIRVSTVSTADLEFRPGTPATIYAGGRSGQFMRSTNTGETWTTITAGLPSTSSRVAVGVSAANSNYVYVLYGEAVGAGKFRGLYRSTDAGSNFSLRSETPNILDGSTTGSGSGSQGWYDLALAISPTNAEQVHVGGINTFKSINGGSTWTNTSDWYEPSAGGVNYTHADIHTLEFFGTTLYCGSDGGVFKSTNNAEDWSNISNTLVISQIYGISVDKSNSNKYAAGLQDNGSNYYENGKFYHWDGADGMKTLIDYTNPNVIYGTRQSGGLQRTDNNGASKVGIKPSGAGSGAWVTPIAMSPVSNTTIFAGYTDVWKTTDRGSTWSNISSGNIGVGTCNVLSIAPSNANYIYVSKGSTLYKTTNGGTSWATINGTSPNVLPWQSITSIAVHPTDPKTAWVSVGGYSSGTKIFRTIDEGVNWTNISSNLPNLPANSVVFQPELGLYLGMDVGVYHLPLGTTTWLSYRTGLPNVIVKELELNGNRLYAGTYGRGMWVSQTAPCASSYAFSGFQTGRGFFEATGNITSTATLATNSFITYKSASNVILSPGFRSKPAAGSSYVFKAMIGSCGSLFREDQGEEISGFYAGPMPGLLEKEEAREESNLTLNVIPNPTKGLAAISFNLQNDQVVDLTVYDMMGKEMERIIDKEVISPGRYTYSIDASTYPNGMYLIRLRAGEKSLIERVVVSK